MTPRIPFIALLLTLSLAAGAQVTYPFEYNPGGHRGIDMELRGGYLFGLGDAAGSEMFSAELSIGKRLSKSFYFGGVIGGWGSTASGSDAVVPIMLEVQTYTSFSKKFALFAGSAIGYGFNTASDITVSRNETIQMPNYLLWELNGGFQISAMRQVDINLGAMLCVMVPVGGSYQGDPTYAIGPRVALNFHKGEKHSRKPIRNSGMQLTWEGQIDNSKPFTYFGPAMAITYKWDPHLSFGLGFAVNYNVSESDDPYIEHSNNYVSSRFSDADAYNFSLFARGQWRVTDRRLSPIAALDLGLQRNSLEEYFDDHTVTHILPYIKPQLGLSLRLLSNNIYLDATLGYKLSPAIDGDVEVSMPDRYNYSAILRHPVPTSGLSFSVGLRSTFNILGRH